MDIALFVAFGLLIGGLSWWFARGKEVGGWVASVLVGVVGGLVGGFFGRVVGPSRDGEPTPLLMSLVVAISLSAIYQVVMRRRRTA